MNYPDQNSDLALDESILHLIQDQSASSPPFPFKAIHVRTFKSGPTVLLDLALSAPPETKLEQLARVENDLGAAVRKEWKSVRDIRVSWKVEGPKENGVKAGA